MLFQEKYLLSKFRKTTFIDVAFFLSTYLYISLLSPYMSTLGISESLKGFFFAAFGFVGIFVAPMIGTISDKIGRFRVIIGGIVLEIVALVGYILAQDPWTLLAFRVLAAIGFNAVSLTTLARVNDTITDNSKRTRITGIFHSLVSAAVMVAPPLGGLIADNLGYTQVFLVSFLLNVVLLIGLVIYDRFFYDDNYAHRKKDKLLWRDTNPFAQIKDVLKDKDLRSVAILGMFANSTGPYATLVLPYLIVEYLGLSNFQLGIIFFIFGFAHVFQYLLGILSEKIGDRKAILIGVGTHAIMFVFLALSREYYVILFVILLKAFGGSLWNVTAWSYMSKIAEKKNIEGKVVGSYLALSRLTSTISFIISGFILVSMKFNMFFIYAGLVFIGLILTYKKIGMATVHL